MALNLYVNIDNSYSATGLGSNINPYNINQFLISLSADLDVAVKNYYISGVRYDSESITSLIFSGSPLVSLNSYNIGANPWRIINTNIIGALNLINYTNASVVNISNGFLQSYDINIKKNTTGLYNYIIKDCWIKSTNNILSDNEINLDIINCTLYYKYLRTQSKENLKIINSILHSNDNSTSIFYCYNNLAHVSANNSVFNYYLSATQAWTDSTLSVNSVNNQENWLVAPAIISADVSAISAQSQINYLLSGFNSISATIGNQNYNTLFWGQTKRDGIGALYFPYITSVILSANENTTSASVTLHIPVIFNWNNVFTSFSASSATLNYNDYVTSSLTTTSALSSTYTYIYNIGSSVPTLMANSKNNWYFIITSGVDLTLTLPTNISADFDIWNSLSADIISANTNSLVIYHPDSLSGNIYSYDWDFGNQTSSTFDSVTAISAIPISTKIYPLSDYNNVRLVLNDSYETSANLLIQRTYSAYYVDLDISYITEGSGSESSAFNYNQFYNRVISGGNSVYGDTYYLKNLREINLSSSSSAFNIDKDKNFTIKAWNTSAYGPWILVFNGNYSWTVNNILASFAGTTLKDGIIYNKPYTPDVGLSYYGSKIVFSNMYNVYVVENESNSKFVIEPYNYVTSSTTLSSDILSGTYIKDIQLTSAFSNIIGSNIYIGGTSGLIDIFTSASYSATSANGYNLNLIDSVLSNFISSAGTLSSCSATIRNCAFNVNSLSATFIVIVNSNSQYNWIIPELSAYPFYRTNVMYEKDMTYILANKRNLRPFRGISATPNPGYGYDTYSNYETGLFGYSRKDYYRG